MFLRELPVELAARLALMATLTPSQYNIAKEICLGGARNEELAVIFGIQEQDVKNRKTVIFDKLCVRDTFALIIEYREAFLHTSGKRRKP